MGDHSLWNESGKGVALAGDSYSSPRWAGGRDSPATFNLTGSSKSSIVGWGMKNSNYREEDKPKPDEVPAGWIPLKATEKAQKGNKMASR